MPARLQSPTLAVLLAVAAACAGCATVPLSLYQTLPSTRLSLAGLEETQRSLEHIGTQYQNSRETPPPARPVAAHGATAAAYQRWVDDEVRELPEVSQIISIGGGN